MVAEGKAELQLTIDLLKKKKKKKKKKALVLFFDCDYLEK